MKPFVSVIVPSFNEADNIKSCITALKAQSYPKNSYEIIVVDNESTDNTPQIAKSHQVKLLENKPGNVGRMRNLGAAEAKGEILAFIDADCVADADWIYRATELILKNNNTIFGGGCILPSNPTIVERFWLLGTPETMLPKDLIGASIVLPKKIFHQIGGFNEKITSGEDTEFSERAEKLNLSVKITEKLSVVHLGNAKTLKQFTKRQVWHSENYLKHIKKSLKDPTFVLICINLMSLGAVLWTAIFPSLISFIYPITVFFAIPAVFSTKRILRAKARIGFSSIFYIYFLDFLYVQARSYSVLRSIFSLRILPLSNP